jgi:hypothetical protein
MSIIGIMLTLWGVWGQAVAASGGHRNCARDWRGGATAGGHRPRKRRNPRKARFFAQQKMRPNNTFQGEVLYAPETNGTRYRNAALAKPARPGALCPARRHFLQRR